MEGSASPLPLRTKLLYSSSSLGGEALGQSRGLWLLFYYAPPDDADIPQLLPLVVVGAILTVGRLVEALDDALIGWWSDRTQSRLGRRLPFILGATPLWALFGFLLFTPPENAETYQIAIYLFIVFELFHLFGTLSGGPYEALLPELARTNEERVTVVGIKVYFGAAGGAVGLVLSGLIIDNVSFQVMALVMASLALAFRYLGMIGVWGRAKESREPARISFKAAMRTTFSNRAFLYFLPSFVLFQIGLQMLLGDLPFYVNAVLGVEEEGTWVAILTAITIAVVIVTITVYMRYGLGRIAKRVAFGRSMLGSAVLFPLLFFAGLIPGIPAELQIVVLMAVIGVPVAGVFLFPAALTADIVDFDSSQTGLRREATYFGSQNFVEKTATSLAPLFLTLVLLAGNTSEDTLGVRLVGPIAGLIVLTGYLIFRNYDLPDEVPVKPPPAVSGSRS